MEGFSQGWSGGVKTPFQMGVTEISLFPACGAGRTHGRTWTRQYFGWLPEAKQPPQISHVPLSQILLLPFSSTLLPSFFRNYGFVSKFLKMGFPFLLEKLERDNPRVCRARMARQRLFAKSP